MSFIKYTVLILSLLLIPAIGCEDSEVQSYSVAKEKVVAPMPVPAAPASAGGHSGHGGPQQMLAAIITQGEKDWFFKVIGDDHFLTPNKPAVINLIKSITFTGDEPTWTTPSNWEQKPGSGMRFATIVISDGSHTSEMSVIALPTTPVLPQINRWRGQLGLEPITEEQLPTQTEHIHSGDLHITFVDFVGSSANTSMAPTAHASTPPPAGASSQLPADHPPVGGAAIPTTAPTTPSAGAAEHNHDHGSDSPAEPLNFTIPSTWTQLPASGMRVATFKIGDSEATIIPLAAGAGDLEANVNRWRGQVGLASLEGAQIEKDCPTLTIDGTPARYVELIGITGDSMLGLIAIRGNKAWFVKLIAPTDLITKEKDNFKAFINSITFN